MPSKTSQTIVVIGAGPIGLFTAHVLASVGCDVTLIDDSRRGAGWASGGMLGGVYETLDAPEFSDFVRTYALSSQRLWRRFLQAVAAPFVPGSVFVARDAHQCDRLTALAGNVSQRAVLERVGAPDEQPHFGLLFSPVGKGLFTTHKGSSNLEMTPCDMPDGIDGLKAWSCPTDIAFDPRAMLSLLRRECVKGGVKIVTGVVVNLEGKNAILATGDQIAANYVVVATGSLAAGQTGAGLKDSVPELSCMTPVKGQMLAVAGSRMRLDHVIRAGRVYIIPRGDHLVIGATSQLGNDSYDTLDRGMHDALWREACTLLPALAQAQIVESWAGLRPMTPDGLPLVGFGQSPNVILATGAYRNGWLFAAAIANSVMGLVLQGPDGAKNLQPFAPNRFPT